MSCAKIPYRHLDCVRELAMVYHRHLSYIMKVQSRALIAAGWTCIIKGSSSALTWTVVIGVSLKASVIIVCNHSIAHHHLRQCNQRNSLVTVMTRKPVPVGDKYYISVGPSLCMQLSARSRCCQCPSTLRRHCLRICVYLCLFSIHVSAVRIPPLAGRVLSKYCPILGLKLNILLITVNLAAVEVTILRPIAGG